MVRDCSSSTVRDQNYLVEKGQFEKKKEGYGRVANFVEVLRMVTDPRGCFLGKIGRLFGVNVSPLRQREKGMLYLRNISLLGYHNSWVLPSSIMFSEEPYCFHFQLQSELGSVVK